MLRLRRRKQDLFTHGDTVKKSNDNCLDVSRLQRDVEALETEKEARGRQRDGRVKSGAMKMVRENLAQIKALHASGHIWNTIAEALAAQGLTQGDGDPITGRRLSSLVSAIEKQTERKELKLAARRQRRDLVRPERAPRLSSDLSVPPRLQTSQPGSLSEELLRRNQLTAVEALFADPSNPHPEG